jgi:hypothetical protein
MNGRYKIARNEKKIGGGTEVYTVCYTGPEGHGCATNVWRSADGTCRCTSCSGPLVGMSRSCKHVQAVKRAVGRQA